MILPEENHYDYDKEIDFLSEECLSLAKDIIDLNEDIDGLTEWTNDFVNHYNDALESVDHNFEILDNRTKETITKHNNIVNEVLDLGFHKACLWCVLIANLILTLLLVFHVL